MCSGKNKTNVQNGKCILKNKYIEHIYTYTIIKIIYIEYIYTYTIIQYNN